MPQILDFLSSDLGVTLHRTRSTGSPRGGDCGGPVPSTAACGEGGEDPEAPPCSLPLTPPPLRWGRGGDKGGPSAPGETLGQPPAGEGPQSRKLVSSWGQAQEELRVPTALVPVPALPPPGWVTRARDLPLWASVSSSANGSGGLDVDAQTPAPVLTQQVPS